MSSSGSRSSCSLRCTTGVGTKEGHLRRPASARSWPKLSKKPKRWQVLGQLEQMMNTQEEAAAAAMIKLASVRVSSLLAPPPQLIKPAKSDEKAAAGGGGVAVGSQGGSGASHLPALNQSHSPSPYASRLRGGAAARGPLGGTGRGTGGAQGQLPLRRVRSLSPPKQPARHANSRGGTRGTVAGGIAASPLVGKAAASRPALHASVPAGGAAAGGGWWGKGGRRGGEGGVGEGGGKGGGGEGGGHSRPRPRYKDAYASNTPALPGRSLPAPVKWPSLDGGTGARGRVRLSRVDGGKAAGGRGSFAGGGGGGGGEGWAWRGGDGGGAGGTRAGPPPPPAAPRPVLRSSLSRGGKALAAPGRGGKTVPAGVVAASPFGGGEEEDY